MDFGEDVDVNFNPELAWVIEVMATTTTVDPGTLPEAALAHEVFARLGGLPTGIRARAGKIFTADQPQ